MPKKKVAPRRKPQARRAQSTPVLSRIQAGIKRMQRDGEAMLSRARKEVIHVSHEQKRAVEAIVREAKRLRTDLEKTVKQTSKELEARSKSVLSSLERSAEKRIEPVVRRVLGHDPTLRQQIHALSRRLDELEQSVKAHSHAEPPPASPASAPVLEGQSPETSIV